MFGLGKKDKDGRQVRIEHRGKHLRASRTGGIAARAEGKVGGVNLTGNTARGLRASAGIAKGARVALQNGQFRLIGRWQSGPFGFNLSKTGVSASAKTGAGTLNFIKPQYSSFKFAGVQIRGRNAAYANLIYLGLMAAAVMVMFAVRVVVFLLWVIWLGVMFVWDFVVGVAIMFRGKDGGEKSGTSKKP